MGSPLKMVPFSGRVRFVIGSFIVFGVTATCAGGKLPAEPVPRDSYRLSVPFFSSQKGDCGPAALTSVLHFWGDRVDPPEVERAVFIPKLGGTLGIDLVRYARERGFEANSFTGTLTDIQSLLRRGYPIIAFLNQGTSWFPRGHFLVITGYEDHQGVLLVHTGTQADHPISYKAFLKDWKKTNFWTLLVKSLPGGQDPS